MIETHSGDLPTFNRVIQRASRFLGVDDNQHAAFFPQLTFRQFRHFLNSPTADFALVEHLNPPQFLEQFLLILDDPPVGRNGQVAYLVPTLSSGG